MKIQPIDPAHHARELFTKGIQLLNKPKKNQPHEPLKSQGEGVEYIQRAAESGLPEQLRPYLLAAHRLARQLGHTECEELLHAHI